MQWLTIVMVLSLSLVSLPLQASMIKISFAGEVTGVENETGEYWDPLTIIGMPVSGHYLVNLEAVGGRQEASFFWWSNIDTGEGSMTSQINVGDDSFVLTNEKNYDDRWDGWTTNEYIYIENAINSEEYGNVPDGLRFIDNEQHSIYPATGDTPNTLSSKVLSIDFHDYINELVIPSEDPALSELLAPMLDYEYTWSDLDFDNNDQAGVGSFSYRYWDYANNGGAPVFDSLLRFNLSEVSSRRVMAEVPAPGTLWLMLVALLPIWTARLSRRSRHSTCDRRLQKAMAGA